MSCFLLVSGGYWATLTTWALLIREDKHCRGLLIIRGKNYSNAQPYFIGSCSMFTYICISHREHLKILLLSCSTLKKKLKELMVDFQVDNSNLCP